MKRANKEAELEARLGARLGEAYSDQVGGQFGVRAGTIIRHRDVLPTLAYYQGYSFVEFNTTAGDPYALIDPDGRVLKVWPGEPPSLTELRETLTN